MLLPIAGEDVDVGAASRLRHPVAVETSQLERHCPREADECRLAR